MRNLAPLEEIQKKGQAAIADGLGETIETVNKIWPELNDAAFHGLSGEVVKILEPHTEADNAALLIQFLIFFGNIIGRGPHYLVEGDRHYTNLFGVIVGDTSKARKGTSEGRIRSIYGMLTDSWAMNCIQSGLSSGEGLIHAVRDGQGDDAGIVDKRLYVSESEFAGLLRIMTRDGNIISRIVRDAWDKGNLGVMTKACPTKATEAHISITGHVTAEELTRYLDRTEVANGFANRFIFVLAKRSKCLPHGGSLNDDDLRPIAKRLASLVEAARKIGRVRMDTDAASRWEAVYPSLSDAKEGLFGAVTARAEAQVIRLALVFALLDESILIQALHLRAALALWHYSEASARYIFGDSAGDPVADTILKALKIADDNGLTRTEISRLLGRHTSSERITNVLQLLKAKGKAACSPIETQGRPVEVWRSC